MKQLEPYEELFDRISKQLNLPDIERILTGIDIPGMIKDETHYLFRRAGYGWIDFETREIEGKIWFNPDGKFTPELTSEDYQSGRKMVKNAFKKRIEELVKEKQIKSEIGQMLIAQAVYAK